jgi:hypothetical protein
VWEGEAARPTPIPIPLFYGRTSECGTHASNFGARSSRDGRHLGCRKCDSSFVQNIPIDQDPISGQSFKTIVRIKERFVMELSASKAIMGASVALLLCGLGTSARADAIPYPTPGVLNAAVYNFTAAATGDIIAYFAGSTADFTNELSLRVNGVSTGVFGLNNHTSALGQSLNLGHANAGDVLTFVMHNIIPGIGDLFSNPALNAAYDGLPVGTQHVYSTAYTSTSPIIDSIPVGIFVSWEDLPFPSSDLNYNDLNFVFTNVAAAVPGPIVGAGLPGLIAACGAMLGLARRRRKAAA